MYDASTIGSAIFIMIMIAACLALITKPLK